MTRATIYLPLFVMNSRALLLLLLLASASAKVFTRCSMARKLLALGANRDQLAEWVCIANYESGLDSAKFKTNPDLSIDHGVFQINNRWWCDVGSSGCRMNCATLLDCDLEDDFRCARQIQAGSGFGAWVTYTAKCSGKRAQAFLVGCHV